MKLSNPVKVGILGATGFTGEKLVELLVKHPYVEISYLSSRTSEKVCYSNFFPKLKKILDMDCQPLDIDKAVKVCDIFFLALPHTVSMEIAPYILKKKKKVIDLSPDYRIKDRKIYKKYYGKHHKDLYHLKKATYGLGEFFKEKIKQSSLVANPGCYPTSILLALAPLTIEKLVKPDIFVSSVSSVTGAGRKPVIEYHYTSVKDNFWAYKPFYHQHTPEITQILQMLSKRGFVVHFVPHVAPLEAGIYSTIYVRFTKRVEKEQLWRVYEKYYREAVFVRLREDLPKLKDVVGTNFCDIGFYLDQARKEAVIVSCLDNLIKGAAGNAVQNMNIMCGFLDEEGLL